MAANKEELLQEPANAAQARKRRMKRMGRRIGESEDTTMVGGKHARDEDDSDDAPCRKKPHPTGIKRQARYDPGVPMTRDELTAWRKEARRVRNRESAAASRRRTRGRIEELEGKVEAITTKYKAALKRIVELEGALVASPSGERSLPSKLSQNSVVTPCHSDAEVSPAVVKPVTGSLDSLGHDEQVEKKYQHIMNMIRPPAAKISGAEISTSPPLILSMDEEPIHTDEPLFQNETVPQQASDSSSSDASTSDGDMDELEIGEFLADALTDFDPLGTDVASICGV